MAAIPHWGSKAAQAANDSVVYYGLAVGAYLDPNSEPLSQVLYRSPGVFSKLTALVLINTRTSQSRYRLRINTADVTQAAVVPTLSTGLFQDASNTDAVAAGGLVAVQLELDAGTGDIALGGLGALFAATTNTITRLASIDGGVLTTARYVNLVGSSSYNLTETNREYQIPTTGTLKNGGVNVDFNTRDGSTTFTLRKNTAPTAMVLTAPAATTGWFEDVVHSVSVVQTDKCSWFAAQVGASGSTAASFLCVDFETTTGRGLCGTAGLASQANGLTRYAYLSGANASFDVTDTDVAVRALQANDLSYLNAYAATNGVNGTSTLKTWVNGAPGAQTVTIPASTSGWFVDAVNVDSLAATDTLATQLITGGSSGTLALQTIGALWGVDASIVEPTVETLSATNVRSTSATLRGRIDPNGNAITGRFRWWLCGESPPVETETDPQSLGSGSNPITYTEGLTGLTPATTYCYRAVSDWDTPDLEGEIMQFTTSGEALFIDGTVSHPLTWIEMYIEDGDV